MPRTILLSDSTLKDLGFVSHCDYFITTDDRILKYRSEKIKIVGPREFARGEGIEF